MKKITITIILIIVFVLGFGAGVVTDRFIFNEPIPPIPEETAIKLASTITVLRPSFLTAQIIDSYVKNTGLYSYGNAFMEAEKQSGIGADYLLSIAIHESGWGSNYWWKDWNNCFSWGITDSGPNSEAYKIKEMSKFDAIVYTAKKIKSLYLTPGGAYYSGTTLSSIGKRYASSDSWATNVINIHTAFLKTLPEEIVAKQWIMETEILKGDLPGPQYYSEDYFTRPLTREELAIILARIQRSK